MKSIHTKKSADSFLSDKEEVTLLSFFFIAFFALAPIDLKQTNKQTAKENFRKSEAESNDMSPNFKTEMEKRNRDSSGKLGFMKSKTKIRVSRELT